MRSIKEILHNQDLAVAISDSTFAEAPRSILLCRRHSRQDGLLTEGLFSVAEKKFLPVAVQGSRKHHRHEIKRVKVAMLAVM